MDEAPVLFTGSRVISSILRYTALDSVHSLEEVVPGGEESKINIF